MRSHTPAGGGIREFRLDRVEHAELLAERFTPPDLAAVDEQLRRGDTFIGSPPVALRVRYSAKVARWIQERYSGTAAPDGSFVVEHPLADLDWAVRHVLQYGTEAEVLEPADARDAVREHLIAMIDAGAPSEKGMRRPGGLQTF